MADGSNLNQLWTDAKSRDLIATEYPWFLNTFDNYTQPIQRADAIRYFVLAHFGGIYIDLDDVSSLGFPLSLSLGGHQASRLPRRQTPSHHPANGVFVLSGL